MNSAKTRVLVIDDDELILSTVGARLEREGFEVLEALDGGTGVERFREGVDVVLLDLALPDFGGEEIFRRLKMVNPSVPVIMMTAHSTVNSAVAMMKEGLFHYAEKDSHYLEQVVRKVCEATRTPRLLNVEGRPSGLEDLIGPSGEMARLRMEIANLFTCRDPVLVVGDSGSGKRLVAEIIHYGSPRASAPLAVFNCASTPPATLEVELFGQDEAHGTPDGGRPGALELADGGTLILGQVGELPGMLQNKLLDYLETGRFTRRDGTRTRSSQVRIVGTSRRSLRDEVIDRQYSKELCLALGGHRPLVMPCLRSRPEDVPVLAHSFLHMYRTKLGRKLARLTPDAVAFLQRQPWPGNVRELKNLIERVVLLADERTEFTEADLLMLGDRPSTQGFLLPHEGLDLAELEKSMVRQALSRTHNNRTRAGDLLGLNRDQVRYRINKFELQGEFDEDGTPSALRPPHS